VATARTRPSDATVKTLFALSANVCAFNDDRGACEVHLTDPSWTGVQARICHIQGLRPGSARYNPAMSDRERNHFDNLLLLCPNHHGRVDDLEPKRYTVEVLTRMKARGLESLPASQWAPDAELARFASAALDTLDADSTARTGPGEAAGPATSPQLDDLAPRSPKSAHSSRVADLVASSRHGKGSMRRGIFPGSFNPLTVAHLAIAEAAVEAHQLRQLDFAVSRAVPGDGPARERELQRRLEALDRAAETRSWMNPTIMDRAWFGDLAESYDVVVMGADKWAQINDPAYYGSSSEARDDAVDQLPTPAVVARGAVSAPSEYELEIPAGLSAVSSSAVRAGRTEWLAPEASVA
jgi:hypothetical protein